MASTTENLIMVTCPDEVPTLAEFTMTLKSTTTMDGAPIVSVCLVQCDGIGIDSKTASINLEGYLSALHRPTPLGDVRWFDFYGMVFPVCAGGHRWTLEFSLEHNPPRDFDRITVARTRCDIISVGARPVPTTLPKPSVDVFSARPDSVAIWGDLTRADLSSSNESASTDETDKGFVSASSKEFDP